MLRVCVRLYRADLAELQIRNYKAVLSFGLVVQLL
jgi:hypothetical protein